MEDAGTTFNHQKAASADKISFLSEIEHARAHALRSALVLKGEEKDDFSFRYLVWAKQLLDMRRKYMAKWFPNIDAKHWCLCKASARLRQLAYEIGGDDIELLLEVDNIVDEIWGDAIGEDLSDCSACKEDREPKTYYEDQ